MKGRDTALLDQEISALSPEDMVDYLSFATGFSGIYIDLNGYTDSGRGTDCPTGEKLDEKAMTSADGTRVFFDLTNFRQQFIGSKQLASIKLKLTAISPRVEDRYESVPI